MFGKLSHFSGFVLRFMSRTSAATKQPVIDSSYAAAMIRQNKCPECEYFMTLACVDGDKDMAHTKRCSKCGVMLGCIGTELVSYDGFYMPIRQHYLETLERERRQALQQQRERPHAFVAKAVADEIDAMWLHQESQRMAAYQLDQQSRKAA